MRPELAEGIRNAVNSLQGWTTAERAVEMAEIMLQSRPKTYLEIGIFGGRTLIAAAMAMRELNEGGMAIGIDPWRIEPALEAENEANRTWWQSIDLEGIHKGCMNAIWAHHLDEWCTVVRANSEYAYKLFDGLECLLIDGNHSEPVSTRDVKLYLPRVAEGGIVIMDDCDWESTKKAQRIVESCCDVLIDKGHYRIFQKRDVGYPINLDAIP
jgi:hypothetical protein